MNGFTKWFLKRPKEVNLNSILQEQSEKYLIFVQQNSLLSFPIQLVIFQKKNIQFLVLHILKREELQTVQSQQRVCIWHVMTCLFALVSCHLLTACYLNEDLTKYMMLLCIKSKNKLQENANHLSLQWLIVQTDQHIARPDPQLPLQTEMQPLRLINSHCTLMFEYIPDHIT